MVIFELKKCKNIFSLKFNTSIYAYVVFIKLYVCKISKLLVKMTGYLPLFPLNMIVIPGTQINLHIFEDRYKQLLTDVLEESTMFGIVPVLKNQIQEYGTRVKLVEIIKKYPDGRMDIRVEGIDVIRLVEFFSKGNGKLYPTGIVFYTTDSGKKNTPISLIKEFTDIIDELKNNLFPNKENDFFDGNKSFLEIVNKVVTDTETRYNLLVNQNTAVRYRIVIEYLKKVVNDIKTIRQIKEIITQNGHYLYTGISEDEIKNIKF
jgi:ATP-dependent Lon protease